MSVKQYTDSGAKIVKFVKKTTENSNLFCDYCQSNGHTRDKCFCLHSYSDWHKLHGKPKPRPRNLSRSNNVCFENVPASIASAKLPVNTSATSSEFSEAQCKQIMQLIQAGFKELNTPSHSSATWNSANTVFTVGISTMYACHSCCSVSPDLRSGY